MPGDPILFNKSVKKRETLRVETAAQDSSYVVAVMRRGHCAGTELWLQPWRPRVQICGLQLGPECPQAPQKPTASGNAWGLGVWGTSAKPCRVPTDPTAAPATVVSAHHCIPPVK